MNGNRRVKLEQAFPFLIVALMVITSITYWYLGDWRGGTYWLSAAVLNFAIFIIFEEFR